MYLSIQFRVVTAAALLMLPHFGLASDTEALPPEAEGSVTCRDAYNPEKDHMTVSVTRDQVQVRIHNGGSEGFEPGLLTPAQTIRTLRADLDLVFPRSNCSLATLKNGDLGKKGQLLVNCRSDRSEAVSAGLLFSDPENYNQAPGTFVTYYQFRLSTRIERQDAELVEGERTFTAGGAFMTVGSVSVGLASAADSPMATVRTGAKSFYRTRDVSLWASIERNALRSIAPFGYYEPQDECVQILTGIKPRRTSGPRG